MNGRRIIGMSEGTIIIPGYNRIAIHFLSAFFFSAFFFSIKIIPAVKILLHGRVPHRLSPGLANAVGKGHCPRHGDPVDVSPTGVISIVVTSVKNNYIS